MTEYKHDYYHQAENSRLKCFLLGHTREKFHTREISPHRIPLFKKFTNCLSPACDGIHMPCYSTHMLCYHIDTLQWKQLRCHNPLSRLKNLVHTDLSLDCTLFHNFNSYFPIYLLLQLSAKWLYCNIYIYI